MDIKKRLSNYWYYYKVHTIVAVFCVIVLAVMLSQCATKERYDYSLTLYMSKPMNEMITSQMAEELEKYGEDLNSDGVVTVEIVNCSYGDNDNVRMNQIAKLQTRLTMSESILFIVDETCYTSLYDMGLFEKSELLPDKEGYALNLGESAMNTAIERELGDYMPKDYYLCKRSVAGTSIERQEDAAMYEAQSLALLEKLCREYLK